MRNKCYKFVGDKIIYSHFLHYPYDNKGNCFYDITSKMVKKQEEEFRRKQKEDEEEREKRIKEDKKKLISLREESMDNWLVSQTVRCESEFGEFNYNKNGPWFPTIKLGIEKQMPDNMLIHIYRVYNPCLAHKHHIENVTRITKDGKLYSLEYCGQCNKYYIPAKLYDYYKKDFRIYIKNISYIHYDYMLHVDSTGFKSDSILSKHGYSVGEFGKREEQRHDILSFILDSKQATKHELSSLIQSFISLRDANRNKNFEISIREWTSDLHFISRYKINEQRFV